MRNIKRKISLVERKSDIGKKIDNFVPIVPFGGELPKIEHEAFVNFKTGFSPLSRLYPKQSDAFKKHFGFISGVLFEKLNYEQHAEMLLRCIHSFTHSYGISFYKEDQLGGWGTNVSVSPIEMLNGKLNAGLIDASFSQAALMALRSAFQQMESEML